MAKIVLSDKAPTGESIHFSLGNADFDLKGKQSYKTDDRDLVANASSHPWLVVTPDEGLPVEPQYVPQVDPKDDPLSAVNQQANDPAAIKAAQSAAEKEDDLHPTAIDAGENQNKVVTTGDVAETLAADDKDKS